MGNSHSGTGIEQTESEFDVVYYGFTTHGSLGLAIEKNEFLRKFNPSLESLAKALWNRYAQTQLLVISDYELLIRNLRDTSDKILFFLELSLEACMISDESDPVTRSPAFHLMFTWLLFGYRPTNLLDRCVFRPLISTLHTRTSNSEISAHLAPLFTDAADDLAKLVISILTSHYPVSLDFSIESGFSSLLTYEVFWLLSVILPSSFKKPGETRIVKMAPLELEQLSHLHKLFDSSSDGFSSTRIKESSFDYAGPALLFLKTDTHLYCLASDQGLHDSLKPYGSSDSRLFQIEPEFRKLVSGTASSGTKSGIIYSNFTAKTSPRGLKVGHQPLASPVIELNEDFAELRIMGSLPVKLQAVEIWAGGSQDQLAKLKSQKAWNLKQVQKEKNRKIKLDEDWRDSADRHLLSLGGVQVNRSAELGLDQMTPDRNPTDR